MKRLLTLILFGLFISCTDHPEDQRKSSGDTTSNKRKTNDTIPGIKTSEKETIDTASIIASALKKMDSIEIISHKFHGEKAFLEGLSTEGGEAELLRNEDSLILKLDIKIFSENGRYFEKIYLNKQQEIICFLNTDFKYNKPIYEKGSKVSNKATEYGIFLNGNLFVILDNNKHKISLDNDEMNEMEKSAKEDMAESLKQMRNGR